MRCLCWVCGKEYDSKPGDEWAICCPKCSPNGKTHWGYVLVLILLALVATVAWVLFVWS
jgi:hypothetical protein